MRFALLAPLALMIAVCGCSSSEVTGTTQPGLQYQGSILTQPNDGSATELSAPLFPDATVFQEFQDPSVYPGLSEAERTSLIDEDVRTFEALLALCAPTHPNITLRAEGDPPLTAEQIATNYDEVARCSYEDYGAKPYWVPQQVDDVDICARKLGDGWHLPTEAEVNAFSESQLSFFQDTLTAQAGSDQFPVDFYYTLSIYVRGSDQGLLLGDLSPGAEHLSPLPVSGDNLNTLYIGDGHPIGLRCLRNIAGSQ